MGNIWTVEQKKSGIRNMGDVMQAYGEKSPLDQEGRVCAVHPTSFWKAGYLRCYKGFKNNEDCKELETEDYGNK